MTRARAALLREPDRPMAVEDVEIGPLREDEVLVRIVGTGVCHTDLSGQDGLVPLPYPAVLGHEGAGIVVECGSAVSTMSTGDRVVLSFASCGECTPCSTGHPAYCDLFAPLNYFGTRLDGTTTMRQGDDDVHGSFFGQSSFASHAVTAARNAVRVPDDAPLELLGPLGCGLLTGAGTVVNVLRLAAGSSLAVFGLGTVGLAAVMAARVVGAAAIVAIDPNPVRRELAGELGATHLIDPTATDDVVWDVMAVSPVGVDATIDAVGHADVVRQAVECLRVTGTCATLGLQGLENDVVINQGHLLLGRTLTGVIEGDADPQEFLPVMLDWWRAGGFPFERLIRTFPFDEIEQALAAARDGSVVKPVLLLGT